MEPKSFLERNKTWLIVVAIIVLLVIWCVSKYNSLVTMNQGIDGQWAQVENQFQRRFDLIPNLEASVKGSFQQEKDVFGAIDQARTQYAGAQTTDQKAVAAGNVESALGRLLVITENYPQLASLSNVKDLMIELEGTENRIAVERGKYNDQVKAYDTSIKQFPGSIIAAMFGFKDHAYFEAASGSEVAPTVNLTN